ncbi:molybdopterin-dependent oxidoreductase [Plantactinospora soyae]|uniref:DMSO/TMAO reductase YedYZ molybdopterin-dependent catalytic subunit n=1 Tax=Plantactinospora soyae TaxID=1544732 RepID=A0A927M7X6_9ACTN|nr:molybdopterin-dependent oxidoreductase [Plantactinospora soyae]MBE1489652.1 DMSO/TMAO reductase YedYZ molybdopterin-dependent catalytic subunit [Plantactinospora soyae]
MPAPRGAVPVQDRGRFRRRLGAGFAGLLGGAAGVAVAQLVAAAARPQAAPLVAVGATVIDAAPTPVKEFAVRTFDTYDKPVLLGGIGLVLAAVAVLAGVLARRRPVAGVLGAALFGLVGAAAALTRPAAEPGDLLPSVAGAVVAAIVLHQLPRRADGPTRNGSAPLAAVRTTDRVPVADFEAEPAAAEDPGRTGGTRRDFVRVATVVAAGTALSGAAGYLLTQIRARDASRSRQTVRLPAAARPAGPLPTGVQPGFHTPNAEFYRVDTALTVPRLDVDDWRLRIRGRVDRPVELRFTDLLRRELVERDITLNCVSSEVGGPYVGTARWLGVPLAPLLREAGIQAGADQVVARSAEGMTIGTPVETVLDGRDAMLVVGMNGEPLPHEHGFPVRMLTPGLYGYAGACKWLTELELSTFDDFDAYWVRRGWAARAPVKTASRIDRPAPFARMSAGTVPVAGVAWAQRRGIRAVEVQVDDGRWQVAALAPAPSADTWVQWRYDWHASPGTHTLRVRAVDGRGEVQTGQRVAPFPSGATGWHTVSVTVA